MARIWTCGFEEGSLDVFNGGTYNSPVIGTTNPRSGSRCFDCSTGGFGRWGTIVVPVLSELYIRVAVRSASVFPGPSYLDFTRFLSLHDSGNGLQLVFRFNEVGLLQVLRASTLLATASSKPVTPNKWYCIEVRALIDNTNGIVQCKVDGTQVIDYSGDTQATSNANVQSIKVGQLSGDVNATRFLFDDTAINDTTGSVQNSWPGDGAVLFLAPNGNGNYSQLTGSDGNQVDNYALVDEVPPSTDDYVQSETVDQRDTYALADLPGDYDTPVLVQAVAYAAMAAAGEGNIKLTVRSGTTDSDDAADQSLGTSYAYYYGDVKYVDPADNGAWTPARVNALEAGVIVR